MASALSGLGWQALPAEPEISPQHGLSGSQALGVAQVWAQRLLAVSPSITQVCPEGHGLSKLHTSQSHRLYPSPRL